MALLRSLMLAAAVLALNGQGAVADTPRHERILLIYNHGSDGRGSRASCGYFKRPDWAWQLDDEPIATRNVDLAFPCTARPNDFSAEGEWGKLGVLKRVEAISERIEGYVDAGYRRENIFLAGHSAGGWSALLLKRHNPGQFNAIIVTAPAFNGQRWERFCEKKNCLGKDDAKFEKRAEMRMRHDAFLMPLRGSARVLAVAIQGDKFGWPNEYPFLDFGTGSAHVYPPRSAFDLVRIKEPCGRILAPDERSMKPGRNQVRWFGPHKRHICGKIPRELRLMPTHDGLASDEVLYGKSRIAHCPKEWQEICELDQHTKVIRHDRFETWMVPRVRAFIAGRLDDWTPVEPPLNPQPICQVFGPGQC